MYIPDCGTQCKATPSILGLHNTAIDSSKKYNMNEESENNIVKPSSNLQFRTSGTAVPLCTKMKNDMYFSGIKMKEAQSTMQPRANEQAP